MTYFFRSGSRKTRWDWISLAAQAALLVWASGMLVLACYAGSMDTNHPETAAQAFFAGLVWAGPLFLYTLIAFTLLLKRYLLGWWLSSVQAVLFTIFIVLLFVGDLSNLQHTRVARDHAEVIEQLDWHVPILCACGISLFAMSRSSILLEWRLAIPTRAR